MPTSTPTNSSRRKPHLITLIISALILVILIVVAALFWQPLTELFSSPEHARAVIADAGPWGPVIFMLMQLAQVLVAPIPGQVTGFIGGLLFGPVLGTIYTSIGAAIGFTIVFTLARKLGRPFVEYFVDPKILRKFDYITDSKGTLVLFLIFLLPAFPDDIICYIAGLTSIKIRTLIIISLLGRLPGYVLLSIAGSGVAESNTQLVVGLIVGMLSIAAVGYWQRKKIEAWIKDLSARSKPPTDK